MTTVFLNCCVDFCCLSLDADSFLFWMGYGVTVTGTKVLAFPID